VSEAMDLRVLFEDRHIVVAVKPAGVPSQADKTGDADMTALLRARDVAARNGAAASASPTDYKVVHRLDRTVGGVMVYAKTADAAAVLSASFAGTEAGDGAGKRYLAVGAGELPAQGVLTNWLLKNERLNVSKAVPPNTPRAKKAVLSFERLAQTETAEDGALSLARVTLETGRHHQIRVQLAHAGAPLWGDTKYNPDFARRRGVFPALWAERLAFVHPRTGEAMAFACPPSGYPFTLFSGL